MLARSSHQSINLVVFSQFFQAGNRCLGNPYGFSYVCKADKLCTDGDFCWRQAMYLLGTSMLACPQYPSWSRVIWYATQAPHKFMYFLCSHCAADPCLHCNVFNHQARDQPQAGPLEVLPLESLSICSLCENKTNGTACCSPWWLLSPARRPQ